MDLLELDLEATRGLVRELQRERDDLRDTCEEFRRKYWEAEERNGILQSQVSLALLRKWKKKMQKERCTDRKEAESSEARIHYLSHLFLFFFFLPPFDRRMSCGG
jgi:hypothetical protein